MSLAQRATEILTNLENELRSKWLALGKASFAPNTKGQGYEIAAKQFLETYLGGPLEFHNRVALIDAQLKLLQTMDPAQNEWDIVAVYRAATPRLVLEVANLRYIPVDAAFFVAEVKKTLTAPFLTADLHKLSRLRKLESDYRLTRIGGFAGSFRETKVLRLLLYNTREIDNSKLLQLLSSNLDDWDYLLVLEAGILYVNRKVKAAEIFGKKPGPMAVIKKFPLLGLLLATSVAIGAPSIIATQEVWMRLVSQHIKAPEDWDSS
jgi:hypothetical protein